MFIKVAGRDLEPTTMMGARLLIAAVLLSAVLAGQLGTRRAAAELRASGAEDFLVEALEQTQAELSASAKKLIQGTFFAVPSAQLTL